MKTSRTFGPRAWRVLATLLMATNACARHVESRPADRPALPATLVGDFVDDYGIAYSISSTEWFQRPRARYHITAIDTVAGYLIAQNDAGNPGDPSLWTRIDWIGLPQMAPYEWAFCLSVYKAPTSDAARAVTDARRDTPRTGCGGYPFSRMKRAPLPPGNINIY